MSIKSNIRREKDNEAKVVLKNLRISPQKLNLVLQMIRRKKASRGSWLMPSNHLIGWAILRSIITVNK